MASTDLSGPDSPVKWAAPQALGLHEGLSHPTEAEAIADRPPLRCSCSPEYLRLRSEHGELVRMRGKAVNRCAYCAMLAGIENCEMLALDALEGDAPGVLLVLGTRTPFPELSGECECADLAPRERGAFPVRAIGELRGEAREDDAELDAWLGDTSRQLCERCSLGRRQMAGFYDGLRLVKRALKRRWPAVEYASLLEFTTGYGPRSGGRRRPHWNLLLKGVPAEPWDAWCAEVIAARVWCKHVDAEPHAQHGTVIYGAEGLMKYLALHFQKVSQQPPAGFTGQRFNCSREYFTGCTRAVARIRAREALALKRAVWRAERAVDCEGERLNVTAHDVELAAQLAYRRGLKVRWVLAGATGTQLKGPVFTLDRVAQLRKRERVLSAAALTGWWLPARELALFTFHDDPGV